MSTHYDFNESNWMDEIKMHYAHNTDIEFDTVCYCDEFTEDDVEFAQDVFIGDVKTTYITTLEEDVLTVFDMPTTTFKSKWSEKVWAKFRDESYVICPICGEKKAEFVAGKFIFGDYVKQYYCNAHHDAYITNGEFVKTGVLL